MLCRAFVNIKDKRILTAEQILMNVEGLFNKIDQPRPELEIVTSFKSREGSIPIDYGILKKRYLLQKGILYDSLS